MVVFRRIVMLTLNLYLMGVAILPAFAGEMLKLKDFVSLESYKLAFVSSCDLGDGVVAFALLPVGSVSGQFIVFQNDGIVSSAGEFKLNKNAWNVTGLSGGLGTAQNSSSLAKWLLRGKFEITSYNQLLKKLATNNLKCP